ncbi:hypothetical protein FE257_003890 [Aspergillus nanangensis]|uniref:Major facilitator superfamily (MFS) profile domain-containing protein n=1 Tax=Aspergillus nanangensis TaxID=2582783 RepID=A0AAD4CB18_ASPNN|nr:hypothetical protein FE257_003890 [Aspergillus nanangensis]
MSHNSILRDSTQVNVYVSDGGVLLPAMKIFILATGVVEVLNSTIGSSVTSGATQKIAEEFNVRNHQTLVLIISVFLIGYVVGPLLWGPCTEAFGRRYPLMIAFVVYTLFMLATALAKSFPSLLVLRLIDGMAASAPIACVAGVYADIEPDITARGRLMAYFMTMTTIGPILGPVISGWVVLCGWRWCIWVGVIFAGVSLPMAIFMPETFAPIILQRRAAKLRKETGNMNIVAPLDLVNQSFKQKLAINLSRPFKMLFYEPITSCSSLFLALTYAIFYLYFQAYPEIFGGVYGMSPGYTGLCFLPIAIGVIIACFIFFWYDGYLSRAKARNASWAHIEEYRRLPLGCLGGPLYVIALFWISWTSQPNIHWIVPALSGIPFGVGYMLNFMAMVNYLTDAYETYSASAVAATTSSRCVLGAVLPLAAKPMFDGLGVNWGCSLIAFLTLGVSVIPFVFIRYGDRIRAKSKFCQELKGMREAEENEKPVMRHLNSAADVEVIPAGPKDLEKQGGDGR